MMRQNGKLRELSVCALLAMLATAGATGAAAKSLPVGYFPLRQLPSEVSARLAGKGDGVVLCRTQANAISYGKKIADHMTPEAALNVLSAQWGHETPCGYLRGAFIAPVEYAVRGDDEGHAITVLKVVDQNGHVYFIGTPSQPPVADRKSERAPDHGTRYGAVVVPRDKLLNVALD